MESWEELLKNDPATRCTIGTLTLSLPTDCPRCAEGVEALKVLLADQFGGFTAWEANGCWLDPTEEQGLVCEPVLVMESGHPCLKPAVVDLVLDVIKESGIMMNQTEMAIKTDRWHFVHSRKFRGRQR
jgi:hypothetical protein